MTHRHIPEPPRPSPLAAGIALAAVAGLVLVGSAAAGRRQERQRQRVVDHPDSAPARTRRSQPAGAPPVVGRSVTINRPREELYAFWRSFENLPKFMSNMERVEETGPNRARWTIAGPGGSTVDVDVEIAEERENELIAWRTLPDSAVTAEGRVSFRDVIGRPGTVVEAEVAYIPPGGEIGRWMGKLFQAVPAIQGKHELKRFKMLMETGEIATSRNRKQD